MSDQAIATTDQPTRHQLAAKGRSAPTRVTGRLKKALDLMVWANKSDSEAAVIARMNVLSIRNALQRAHVKAYFYGQRDVLRTRESPRNIHTLIEVRDASGNGMARVQAVKALEQIGDDAAPGARGPSAGFVIMVVGEAHMSHMRENAAKPLINHGGGHKDE